MQRDVPSRVSYVVIGIDQYQRWPRLRHAVSDALGAARLFEHLGCAQAAPPLLDGAATRDAMHRLATVDLAHLTLDDSLVVFFAGHGHTHTADFTDVLVKTGYVVPADGALPDHHAAATWLRLDGWLSDIARLPPRHILVMIDACHGGVTLGDLHRWRDEGSLPVSDLSALRERRSRRVIISALDDQRAMDHGPYPGHSLFTGCLIEALLGGLATHGQRATTGRALGQYLRTRVATYPQSAQTPDCGAFELDDRGDIVLPVQPPGTSRVEQSSLVAHAPAPESRPPSLVGVVAPHRPGQPSTVGRTMRSRRARGGAVAVVVAVLGVCVAFGYARMRNAAITGDAGLTSGGSMEVHKAASDDGAPRGAWPPSPPSPPAAPPTPLPDPATTGTAAPIDVKAASAEITLADRARADAIARDRKLLFDHIDRQLARSRHDERYFSYRILRGQLFLVALIRGAGLPSAEYLPWLRGYIDNQLALIKELQTVQSARGLPTFLGFGTFAPGDEQLAVNAGVSTPGLYAFVAPHVVMNDVAALLVFGAPPFGSQIETDDLDLGEARRICYYKLDRGWSGLATRLLDEALREIAAHEVIYKEREAVRTLRKYAGALLALGQPAQAVAKLQTALSSYPRSEQFNEVRRDLEEILNGELPKPACRDPR